MSAIKISPSILSADMANLARDLDRISCADYIHVDVMDGHFVANLSYGTAIVKACKSTTDIPLDVHLMISNPDDTVDWYIDAGADLITVHYEASTHLHRTICHIKDRGCKTGRGGRASASTPPRPSLFLKTSSTTSTWCSS